MASSSFINLGNGIYHRKPRCDTTVTSRQLTYLLKGMWPDLS